MTARDSAPPRRDGLAGVGLGVLGLAVCLGYLVVELAATGRELGFPLDDSWIHLQFARNLAAGHGLSYNPGELVTGSTAPLWTALVSILFLLPGNVLVWVKLLGAGLYVASVLATRRLAEELGLARGLATLAALLCLATSWLAWSALSGMEIPLFVCLSLWGLILHLRERRSAGGPPVSLLVFAAAALARPEGFLLLALAAADRLLLLRRDRPARNLRWQRPRGRELLEGLALALAALAGPLLFYAWAGGSVLPTTYAAKGAGGVRHLLPSLPYLTHVVGIFWRAQPVMTLLAGAGVLVSIERLGTRRDRGLLPALWFAGLPLAYAVLTPGPTKLLGNFGRYLFPLFPVLVLLGALGLARAARVLAPPLKLGRLRLPLGVVLAAAVVATAAWPLARGAVFYGQNVANVHRSDVALARWLAPRLPAEALLAVNDIGAFKYFLPNRVVDLASIATPEIRVEAMRDAASGRRWDEAMLAAIERRRPDYVIIFPGWLPAVAHDSRFRPVHRLTIPGNVTMGGDEIVVYATPWTRFPLAP